MFEIYRVWPPRCGRLLVAALDTVDSEVLFTDQPHTAVCLTVFWPPCSIQVRLGMMLGMVMK